MRLSMDSGGIAAFNVECLELVTPVSGNADSWSSEDSSSSSSSDDSDDGLYIHFVHK